MSIKMLRFAFLAACVCFGTAACSTTPLPSEVDLFADAKAVPVVAGQAVSIFHRLQRGIGLQATATLKVATLTTEDFDGRAFTHLNFFAPVEIGDPLAFGLKLKGDEWDPKGTNTSPWTTVITGATTARSVTTEMSANLELLRRISRAVQFIGGRERLKRLVTLNGGFDVSLETKDGRYYTTDDPPQIYPDDVLRTVRETYASVVKRNNTKEVADALKKEWKAILEPEAGQPTGGSLASFTRSNGALDLSRASDSVRQMSASHFGGVRSQRMDAATQDCWPFLWWSICDPSWYGGLTRTPIGGGVTQDAAAYNHTTYDVNGLDLMGCAPASFISLVWWSWRSESIKFYGLPYNNEPVGRNYGSSVYGGLAASVASRMADPGTTRQAVISRYMGGFRFLTGVLVTPQGFIDGGNAWLRDQKAAYGATPSVPNGVPSGMRVIGGYNIGLASLGGLNVFGAVSAAQNAFNFLDIVRDQVGYNDRAVIALYPTGGGFGLEAHYSPVLSFHLIRGSLATVWVRPVDTFGAAGPNWNPGQETNLGNTGALATGVFYLGY